MTPPGASHGERAILSSERAFGAKVQELHQHWQETRETSSVVRNRDRTSQLTMLRFVFDWCAEAATEIRAVYGPNLVELSGTIDETSVYPGFFLKLGPGHQLSADLNCEDQVGDRWSVHIRLRFPEEPQWVLAHWAKRTSNWTRPQVEQLLLSLLSSLERQYRPKG